jgi:molecular chaperone Hsp33
VGGEEELKDLIKIDDGAELTCYFCNEVYNFNSNELQSLIN